MFLFFTYIRIYIKKVRKFPEFAIKCEVDKKLLKAQMDNAFQALKDNLGEQQGHERYVDVHTTGA